MYVCICGHIPDLSQLFVLPPVSLLLLLLLLSRSVVSLRFVFSMYLALSRLNDASFCHCCCCHCVNIFCPPCFFITQKYCLSFTSFSFTFACIFLYFRCSLFLLPACRTYYVSRCFKYILHFIYIFLIFERIIIMNNQYGK